MGWDFQGGQRSQEQDCLVVGIGECMNTINNTRWYGEIGECTSFDVTSSAVVEKEVGTMEVSCWSEAYSRFCA